MIRGTTKLFQGSQTRYTPPRETTTSPVAKQSSSKADSIEFNTTLTESLTRYVSDASTDKGVPWRAEQITLPKKYQAEAKAVKEKVEKEGKGKADLIKHDVHQKLEAELVVQEQEEQKQDLEILKETGTALDRAISMGTRQVSDEELNSISSSVSDEEINHIFESIQKDMTQAELSRVFRSDIADLKVQLVNRDGKQRALIYPTLLRAKKAAQEKIDRPKLNYVGESQSATCPTSSCFSSRSSMTAAVFEPSSVQSIGAPITHSASEDREILEQFSPRKRAELLAKDPSVDEYIQQKYKAIATKATATKATATKATATKATAIVPLPVIPEEKAVNFAQNPLLPSGDVEEFNLFKEKYGSSAQFQASIDKSMDELAKASQDYRAYMGKMDNKYQELLKALQEDYPDLERVHAAATATATATAPVVDRSAVASESGSRIQQKKRKEMKRFSPAEMLEKRKALLEANPSLAESREEIIKKRDNKYQEVLKSLQKDHPDRKIIHTAATATKATATKATATKATAPLATIPE